MADATSSIAPWLQLLTTVAGAGGQAYLGAQEANEQQEEQQAALAEKQREFNAQNTLDKTAQPVDLAGNLMKIRQQMQPQYDFLSALGERYGGT